jgi:hypothetical protein
LSSWAVLPVLTHYRTLLSSPDLSLRLRSPALHQPIRPLEVIQQDILPLPRIAHHLHITGILKTSYTPIRQRYLRLRPANSSARGKANDLTLLASKSREIQADKEVRIIVHPAMIRRLPRHTTITVDFRLLFPNGCILLVVLSSNS